MSLAVGSYLKSWVNSWSLSLGLTCWDSRTDPFCNLYSLRLQLFSPCCSLEPFLCFLGQIKKSAFVKVPTNRVADGIQNHSLTPIIVHPTNALRSRKPRTFLAHKHYAQGHFLFFHIQQHRFDYYCSLITTLCIANIAIFK